MVNCAMWPDGTFAQDPVPRIYRRLAHYREIRVARGCGAAVITASSSRSPTPTWRNGRGGTVRVVSVGRRAAGTPVCRPGSALGVRC